MRAAVGAILKGLIRVYQMLASPLLGHNCRYLPNCSTYAMEAIERYGPVLGSWLATKRICRCHPWGGDGFDPVPHPQRSSHAPENSSDHGSATVPSRGLSNP